MNPTKIFEAPPAVNYAAVVDDCTGRAYDNYFNVEEHDARVLRQAADILRNARAALRALPMLASDWADVDLSDIDGTLEDTICEFSSAAEILERERE
jgi:hypothetical protein